MNTTLTPASLGDVFARVSDADAVHTVRYPGTAGGRQPLHTVYVPADRFSTATIAEHGAEALRLLETHAGDPARLAAAFDLPADPPLVAAVLERVRAKLRAEPIEDLRIDFEDGYGVRGDEHEDGDVAAAAAAVAEAAAAGSLPPFCGLRVKPFCIGLHERSARTLDLFLSGVVEGAGGHLPDGFAITLPKILSPAHVAAFADLCERLERALGLADRSLRLELQVETTQSIVNHRGEVALLALLDAAAGRCSAAHFGTYDYTAACGLPPQEQRITHPACDFARHVMQVTLAGTGVRLSDGSTNVIPASDHPADVRRAWRLHAGDIRHSLAHGFYQGWDLHPAQLPSRFATVYAWLLAGLDAAVERVRAWTQNDHAAGGVLDEPATVSALLGQLRRAVDCGAVPESEVLRRCGIDAATLHGRH